MSYPSGHDDEPPTTTRSRTALLILAAVLGLIAVVAALHLLGIVG